MIKRLQPNSLSSILEEWNNIAIMRGLRGISITNPNLCTHPQVAIPAPLNPKPTRMLEL